jgi:hypothetical protein
MLNKISLCLIILLTIQLIKAAEESETFNESIQQEENSSGYNTVLVLLYIFI